MKLRIVIPVYNQVDCLRLCLRSIRETAPEGTSIHVIDNASHENVRAALDEEIPGAFPAKIYTRNERNLGVYKPWNRGLDQGMADGADVICISNSDVIYGPGALEFTARAALERGAAFPYSIQGGPKPEDFEVRAAAAAANGYRENALVVTGGFAGWSFFLPRATVEKVGRFDDENFTLWYGDTCYHHRLNAAGLPPVEVRCCLLHHFESKTIKSMPGQFDCYGWREEDARRFYKKYPQ